jgi:hypothetical protein
MQTWEYHVTTIDLSPSIVSELKSFLADAGSKGWELVTVTQIQGHAGPISVLVTMKRPAASI